MDWAYVQIVNEADLLIAFGRDAHARHNNVALAAFAAAMMVSKTELTI